MNTNNSIRSGKNREGKEQYSLLLDNEKDIVVVSGYKRKKKKNREDAWYYLGTVGQIGYTIALPIAGGALLGVYIDRTWSTYPKATLIFLFGGIALSFLTFIRIIRNLMDKKN
jgi:predicted F0F1-ATPase subunit